ncbi:uncharacterized protein LOC101753720 [Setaria italica]|uniref:uncharacterized protein LOC101753720 n=1 Tax=Setaria italica TaxID=4555 RepID=UPI0007199EA1|nr:uncharacterized protein LOC101753720 [Setaria italica]
MMRGANAKKRKAPATAKGKKSKESSALAGEQKDPDAKRCKTEGAEEKEEESPVKPKSEQAGSDSSIEDGRQKPRGRGRMPSRWSPQGLRLCPCPCRRGQATHTLTERTIGEKREDQLIGDFRMSWEDNYSSRQTIATRILNSFVKMLFVLVDWQGTHA